MQRLAAFATAVLALAGLSWLGSGSCDLNLAPLSTILVDGKRGYLNPRPRVERRAADVVIDGLFDNQYELELPPGDHVVDILFPRATICNRIELIGAGGQKAVNLTVRSIWPNGTALLNGSTQWVSKGPKAPTFLVDQPTPIRGLRLEFSGDQPIVLNSILCHTRVRRWEAWTPFVGLQLALPWVCGLVMAAAFLGWGLLFVRSPPDAPFESLTKRLLVGAAVVPGLATGWLLLPPSIREGSAGAWLLAAALLPGLAAAASLLRNRRQGGVGIVVGLAALSLLATVAVDGTLVANRRVKPMDHLFGLIGAQHLLAGAAMSNEMNLRPWYLQVLAAPLVQCCGDQSYWIYLGEVAWLNALALIPAAMWAERWKRNSPKGDAALLALLPALHVLHFPGQRPFAASMALAAIHFWTDRSRSGWWAWGGVAAALAVFAHPGSLFALPPAAVYLLATAKGARIRTTTLAMAIPLAAWAAWTAGVRHFHPETRNYLLYYPIMRNLNDAPPEGKSLPELVWSLPAEHLKELAWNRVLHLRHYIWSYNPWHTEISEIFRPVSLPSTLGFVLTLALPWMLRAWWTDPASRPRSFLWLAVVGPLLLFHAHIGQAFPQFHILPLPFFAFALIAASMYRRLPEWVRLLALLECLLRQIFPVALLYFFPLDEYTWFGSDPATGYVLGSLPVVVWLALWRLRARG